MEQEIRSIIYYKDVFLIISKGSSQRELSQFLRILDILNVPFKESKLEGPSTCITFLGIMLDTKTMSVSVPPTKRKKIQESLTNWADKKWCYKRDLQSLVGSLM